MPAIDSFLNRALRAVDDHLFVLPVLMLATALSVVGVVLALAHLPADPSVPVQPEPACSDAGLPAPSA